VEDIDINRRRHPRYNTEMDVYFKVRYDINVRVEFQVIGNHRGDEPAPKYFGLCNNVSAEGLLIVSKKQLVKDDLVLLEVYDNAMKNPIRMEGQVRWCGKCPGPSREHDMVYIGIQITSVNGVPVIDSIYFDRKHMVVWSVVLESVFGTYAAIKKKEPGSPF